MAKRVKDTVPQAPAASGKKGKKENSGEEAVFAAAEAATAAEEAAENGTTAAENGTTAAVDEESSEDDGGKKRRKRKKKGKEPRYDKNHKWIAVSPDGGLRSFSAEDRLKDFLRAIPPGELSDLRVAVLGRVTVQVEISFAPEGV